MSIGNKAGLLLRWAGANVALGAVIIGQQVVKGAKAVGHEVSEAKLGLTGVNTEKNHKVKRVSKQCSA